MMYEMASEARSRTLASAVDASATSKQAVDRTKRILELTEAEGDDYNQIPTTCSYTGVNNRHPLAE